jgi:hypothetical protein
MQFANRQAELDYRHNLLTKQREQDAQKLPLALTAISGTNTYYANRPIWIDMSDYQPVVNWAALKGKIAGVMIKLGEVDDTTNPDYWIESKCAEKIGGAASIGIPAIGYFFVNTAWPLNVGHDTASLNNIFDQPIGNDAKMLSLYRNIPEIAMIIRAWAMGSVYTTDITALRDGRVRFRTLAGLALDVERWWRSYTEYYTNAATAHKVEDFWIMFWVKWLKEKLSWMMQHGYLPQVPLDAPDETLHYSAGWFIKQYAPVQFLAYLGDKQSWPAGYYFGSSIGITTLDAFRVNWLSKIPDDWRPYLFGNVKFLQISGDQIKIPEITNAAGAPVSIDVNVSVHSTGEDYAWLGFTGDPTPVPTPTPIPEPVVHYFAKVRPTSTALKLRCTPDASITTNILDKTFCPSIQFELHGAPVADGTIVWASLGKAYFAVKNGTDIYADVIEVSE